MQTITQQLLAELKNAADIESFLKSHEDQFINTKPSEYLSELLAIKDISIASIVKKSGAGEYVYKIFNGERNPSRDVLISIAFGIGLSLEETQLLLRISKFAHLDSRDKRDSVIIYALTHGLSVFETDDLLQNKDMVTIN